MGALVVAWDLLFHFFFLLFFGGCMTKNRLAFSLAGALVLFLILGQSSKAQGPVLQRLEGLAAEVAITPDVVYGHKDGMALTFDVFQPNEKPNGVGVLFMVSGGWVSAWTDPKNLTPLFSPLLKSGYTVIAVRHGSSPRYVVPECVADVQLALTYIADKASQWKIDKDRLGVFGFSAGGHLSLMLGTAGGFKQGDSPVARVAAVVAVFPPTDLEPYVDMKSPRRQEFPALRFDPAMAGAVSPLKLVTKDDAPTLLVHGDKDELVPLWHSEKIDEAFQEAEVDSKLVVIQGAAHGFDAAGNARLAKEMVEWFDSKLAPSKE